MTKKFTPELIMIIKENYADTVVLFDCAHKNEKKKSCQLFLAMSGDKEFIMTQLMSLLVECGSKYGKPVQGRTSKLGGYIDVITPIWENREY